METITATTAKLFLTDYASYNEGTQFEFGHWVDLDQFSDADEFLEYIKNHFEECDKKSPLPFGAKREETMFTDYEGFPDSLYGESMGKSDLQKIFDLVGFIEDQGLENLDNEGDNLLSLWNEYCSENNPDDEIYQFDDDTIEMLYGNDAMEAFQAGCNSQINWSDDYLYLDGYANIVSLNDPSTKIDETILIDWILENKI